jgi:hypothetical protein
MDVSFAIAKNGSPTCAAGPIALHSSYEPALEAARYAKERLGSSRPSHVVLLGPCLDYLSSAVRAMLPKARLVSVQYASAFAGKSVGTPDASWHPGLGRPLASFLDAALDEDAISGVAAIEWEPASRAFPEAAALARAALAASLDRLTSSMATVKAFGRSWIANACSSFLLAERALALAGNSSPTLVAAAGPSLSESLAEIRFHREGLNVIAVSSALAACEAAGVIPDLVVSTDGGNWSRLHLYPLRRSPVPLASPLSTLPSACVYERLPLLFLDQGSFAESELLPLLGPSTPLPAHGTVSGTAIRLAAALGGGPIVVAGLDLACRGEADHASPHGFDHVEADSSSRLSPLEGGAWSRCASSYPLALGPGPWKSSRGLGAYASALALDAASLPGRLYRMRPSPVELPGFAALEPGALASLAAGGEERGPVALPSPLPPKEARESLLGERLASWRALAASASAALGAGEANASALPGGVLVAELLRSVDIVDYAAARRAALAGQDPSRAAAELGRRCDEFLSALQRRFTR